MERPESAKSRLKIFVRIRPNPEGSGEEIATTENNALFLKDVSSNRANEFYFDRIMDKHVQQKEVYEDVGAPLVNHVLGGYNACCFAYGQTGSGKTYTMFGEETGAWEKRGVIPLAVESLFAEVQRMEMEQSVIVKMSVSFMEIYLDHVRDLGRASLANLPPEARPQSARDTPKSRPPSGRPPSGRSTNSATGTTEEPYDHTAQSLEVQEDADGNVKVKDLTQIMVTSAAQVMDIVKAGLNLRQTHATQLNDVSSRSHTVFTLTIAQQRSGARLDSDTVVGRLNLVDLAGSERLKKSESEGQRLKEMKSINTSLSVLGKVVLALAQGEKGAHVPYRDCKLTRILKDSLAGNSYTALLATLYAKPENYEESLSTLQFAHRCTAVATVPHVNYVSTDALAQERLVNKLYAEIEKLKTQLEATHTHYQKQIVELGGELGPLERSVSDESVGEEGKGARKASGTPKDKDGKSRRRGFAEMSEFQAQLELQEEEIKSMEEDLQRKDDAFKALRERIYREEAKHSEEVRTWRRKVEEIQKIRQEELLQARSYGNKQEKQFVEALDSMQEQNLELKKQLATSAQAVPKAMQERLKIRGSVEQMEVEIRTKLEAEFRKKLMYQKAQNQSRIDNLKEQSEFFINKRAEELQAFIKEYNEYKEAKEGEVAQLRQEGKYLAEYLAAITRILERLESGAYSLKEKSGVKAFVIPSKEKPGALDMSRCQAYRTKLEQAERYLRRMHTKDADKGRPMTAPAISTSQGSQGLSLTPLDIGGSHPPSMTAGSTLTSPGALFSMDEETLRSKFQELQMRVLTLEAGDLTNDRNEMKQQVLTELAAHPTVEYIKALEEDVARYQKALQEEKKRNTDMRIALEQQKRTMSGRSGIGTPPNGTRISSGRSAGNPRPLIGQSGKDAGVPRII